MHVLPTNRRSTLVTLALTLFALLLVPLALAEDHGPLTPQQAGQQAWDLARFSGAYAFQSGIDQQTTLGPGLQNVGRPPRPDELSLRGNVDQPADTMQLQLWRSLSPQPQNPVE